MEWPTQTIQTPRLEIAYAEQGSGPLVILCHGWPELSFSWRHQLPVLARAGYRAVAPDMRGYGGTSKPESIEAYTILDLVADMTDLVEALDYSEAIVIGHDWGAVVAWHCALLRPDIFRAVAALSVPFARRARARPLDIFRERNLKNFYWMYFQKPGEVEAEFARDWDRAIRSILYGRGLKLEIEPGGGMVENAKIPQNPPAWISEAEIQFYIETFRRTGLAGGFHWYRNIDRNWELMAAWRTAKIMQPAVFIAGDKDPVVTGAGGAGPLKDLKRIVPNLTKLILIEQAGHWIQQERPDEVNAALLEFLRGIDGDLSV